MKQRHESLGSRAMRRACAVVVLAIFGVASSAACSSGSSLPGSGSGGSAGAPGAGSSGGGSGSVTSGESGGPGAVGGGAGSSAGLLPNCEPVYPSCAGLCGPVSDPCTGAQLDCGGCPADMACDRDSHRCVAPKLTCQDLGAECGRVRNTCGVRLECGDCAANEECDPDSNTCVACSQPSCEDLGFECGSAWLGCGPRTELTHCGDCATGMVCNDTLNRCEPAPAASGGTCVPQASKDLGAAANAECGYISDGCGGTVECGNCAKGLTCATGGIANRCGPPEEPWQCAVEDRQCGKTSLTCGGKQYTCGTCTKPDVCNENGKCGPPCTPALPPDASNVACGTFDDGCKGKISKACPESPQGTAQVCMADGSCCAPKTCAVEYKDQCGSALPDGCGSTLNCACAAGNACSSKTSGIAGTCCELPRCEGQCGVTLTNDCGSRACKCGSGQACDAESGTCCALPKCNDACNTTLSNDCGSVDCKCPATAVCGTDNTCCTPRTCGGFYAGNCGSDLDDGCGGTIDCACSGDGNVCSSAAANTPGTCSCPTLLTCAAYPNQCGELSNGCGGTIRCTCADQGRPAYETCGGGEESGVCGCTTKACSGRCGAVDDGCGGQLDCGPC
jgi:hypothetical protein